MSIASIENEFTYCGYKGYNLDRFPFNSLKNIMDGRVKLDEVLIKRGIKPSKCQDMLYLKRHI